MCVCVCVCVSVYYFFQTEEENVEFQIIKKLSGKLMF